MGVIDRQTALVARAEGGARHLAVQFARAVAGARVIGAGWARNQEFVLGLGADDYIDYTEQDVAEAARDVDVALDTVGQASDAPVPTLREGGILVTIANAPPEDAAGARGPPRRAARSPNRSSCVGSASSWARARSAWRQARCCR